MGLSLVSIFRAALSQQEDCSENIALWCGSMCSWKVSTKKGVRTPFFLPSKRFTQQRKEAVHAPMQIGSQRIAGAEVAKEQSLDNLWLAQTLFDLGGIQFGNFTVSESAVSSPVFINPKVLIGNPTALRVASKLMQQEIGLAQSLRRPKVHPFSMVAGVPVGGLLLATAYSLETNTPLIYARTHPEGTGTRGIEGRFMRGDAALIIDDLITSGSSVLETAALLEESVIKVKDVLVLVDREHGAGERLRRHGYNLMSILKLDVMLTHYMSKGLISEETYRTCAEYLRSKQDDLHTGSL
jgi:orotate phosphoribosyltransferase